VIDEGGYGADASAPVVAKTFNYLVSHPVPALTLRPALTLPTGKNAAKSKNSSTTTTTTTAPTSAGTTTAP
jgi:hypothetical protein